MFYGKLVKLRGLELSDVDHIMASDWNDFEMRKFLHFFTYQNREDVENWIKRVNEAKNRGTGFTYAILTHNDEWIGTCSLVDINPIHKSAELGIIINTKSMWNKGYGTDAMIVLCTIGFQLLNLNRIELEFHEFNKRGERVYQKLGFQLVGRKRQRHFILGKYHDSIVMDLLRDEFLERHPEVKLKQQSG
ncbi:MAG: GNAT family N-acetyltransferase [Candidatus Kariarchaeaceae archaeon]|jgi:RimJ/RimL family protein N-acetyltransferase